MIQYINKNIYIVTPWYLKDYCIGTTKTYGPVFYRHYKVGQIFVMPTHIDLYGNSKKFTDYKIIWETERSQRDLLFEELSEMFMEMIC